jgi:hypothetical protein
MKSKIFALMLFLFNACSLVLSDEKLKSKSTAATTNIPVIALEEQYCKGIQNTYDCAQTIERHKLTELYSSANKNLVSRQLKLNLKNKQTKLIEENPEKGPFYNFREYFKEIGYLVFHIQKFEGDAYSMISESSAKEFILPGVPILSPNAKKLIATSYDLIAGYDPNSIQVWRISATDMTREMTLDPEPVNWGPSDASWIDDQTIYFTKNILTEESFPACSVKRMKLVFNGNNWKMFEI